MKKYAVIVYTISVLALFLATQGANVPILPPV